MHIVGRQDEKKRLETMLHSGKPEFVVVYGRRRVGKTYLISEFFQDCFAFRAAGLADGSIEEQLAAFGEHLTDYGAKHTAAPKDWLEAFAWLKELLQAPCAKRHKATGRKVVFIDEMPWFDTPRSGFKTALEHFWNAWGSTQEDLVFIVCGSATSWLVNNLLADTKGLYNRATRIFDLQPFSLTECSEYYGWRDMGYSVRQIVESYMVFGGVPFYMDLQERGLSLAQNVDALMFERSGQLRFEFDRLFATLFRNPQPYVAAVRALSKRKSGLLREDVSKAVGTNGGKLTKILKDLELCGFVRSYRDFTKKEKGKVYQLVDPFTLFHFSFLDGHGLDSWMEFVGTPAYYTWAGLSFEIVCLLHVQEIKSSLGIAAVQTNVCAWRSTNAHPGAQVDLLIDRRDGVINLCEMKYSDGEYVMTATEAKSLRNKLAAFRAEVATRQAVHPTLVTLEGARNNDHFNSVVLNSVAIDDWL